MLSLMAGQASVDVGVDGYRIMGWEEVEDSKKVSCRAQEGREERELTCLPSLSTLAGALPSDRPGQIAHVALATGAEDSYRREDA